MPQQIAFLRAINVGGHTIKMDRLRSLFAELGFHQVETFIASGNVIFASPEPDARRLEAIIEAHLHQALGYEVITFIRLTADLPAIAAPPALETSSLSHPQANLYVGFLKDPPSPQAQQRLAALSTPSDEFILNDREFYWQRLGHLSDSTITGAHIEKALAMPSTLRNITTLRKLAARYA